MNALNEVTIQALFNPDTTGLFRMTTGGVNHQINFIWRFVGDSLSIQEVYLTPEQSAPLKEAATLYAVTKKPYGYLLTGNREQIVLKRTK